ncbi:MAG: chloride channel protein [Capnocytophaga sp.]|nr:chloride channel protein [Capnocytophaga sp.]
MNKLLYYLKIFLRLTTDKINNQKIKNNLFQAIPFWVGAVLTALMAIFYTQLFNLAEHLLASLMNWHRWAIFVVAPSGFVISWWLVKRFAPYARGSGIPQVMAAVEISTPKTYRKIGKLLSLRVMIVKILSSMVLVLGGGAVGREGPTIQISGSIFKAINEWLPASWPKVSKKNMIMTGAAAGLSAAFNTPLGGIVFAIEELTRTHFSYFKTALFSGVIIAGFLTQSISGSYLYIGSPEVSGVSLWVVFPVILIALICGLSSSLLAHFLLKILKYKERFSKTRQHITFLIISGLIVAALAFFVNELILGSGKNIMEMTLFGEDKTLDWYVPIFRMLGTGISFASGGSGGIFAPSLAAGASVGAVIAGWLQVSVAEANIMILAGMVAFLVGMTRAPFTSAILVLEMTNHHGLIFHLMLAGLVASLVAMLVSRHSFYDVLKVRYLKELFREERP